MTRFNIFAVQQHDSFNGTLEGFLSDACDELLAEGDQFIGRFTLDEVARIVPHLDYEGCKLIECKLIAVEE